MEAIITNWDYIHVRIDEAGNIKGEIKSDGDVDKSKGWQGENLNKLGNYGWELVSVNFERDGKAVAFLKRPSNYWELV